MDVSTPENPEYGNHKTVKELYEMIRPSTIAINAIYNYLYMHFDVDQVIRETPNDDLLSINTNISKAEQILNCEYYDYISDMDSKTIVSRVKLGTDYNLDQSIGKYLYFVSPTHRFPYLQQSNNNDDSNGSVNPIILRTLYNVDNTSGLSNNNSQGIASFRNNYYDIKDLETFWLKYNIQPCNVTNIPSNQSTGHHVEASIVLFYFFNIYI